MRTETYEVGRVLTMKKAHPCGCKEWTIAKVGADVKIRCNGCDRFVELTRTELARRVKPSGKRNPSSLEEDS